MSERQRDWSPTLRSRIAFLEAEVKREGSGRAEVRLADVTSDIFLGIDADGSLSMRIGCDPKTVSVDDSSASVRFVQTPTGYRITIAPNADRNVSIHLLEDVVRLLEEGHPPGDAGRAALQRFRELLARPAGAPLSDQALVGLYGELEVLEMLLELGGDFHCWTGWNKDHNDFRIPGLVIEVKSTTSAEYRRVRIHGLRQLADPEDGSELLLVLRRLESSPDGRSVPDLTDALVRLGASRSVLLDHMSQLGYSEQHRGFYEQRRFVSQEVALRRIDDEHPRLTPSALAAVDLSFIDRIDYELNLNGALESDLDVDLKTFLQKHLESL